VISLIKDAMPLNVIRLNSLSNPLIYSMNLEINMTPEEKVEILEERLITLAAEHDDLISKLESRAKDLEINMDYVGKTLTEITDLIEKLSDDLLHLECAFAEKDKVSNLIYFPDKNSVH
jgi:hypothetical protein